MIIEILLFVLVLWLLFESYSLKELKKHDKHLFQFCEIRRDAMKLLRDDYESLSKKEYEHLHQILMSL